MLLAPQAEGMEQEERKSGLLTGCCDAVQIGFVLMPVERL